MSGQEERQAAGCMLANRLPNYLSTDEDRRVAVDSLRLVRRIMGQPASRRFKPEKFRPGRAPHSDEEIGTTIFHPVGTARMGLADDPMAAELLLSADRKALAA